MRRIRNSDLDDALTELNDITPPFENFRYDINTDLTPDAYSLVTKHDNHTWLVSQCLPTKRAMYDWMWAYIAGIEDGQKILTSILNKKKD